MRFFCFGVMFIFCFSALGQEHKECPKKGCRKPYVCTDKTNTCEKPCVKDSDCGTLHICDDPVPDLIIHPEIIDETPYTYACFNPIKALDLQCKKATLCQERGICSYKAGKSMFQCYLDCKYACKAFGLCINIDGICKATENIHCAQSKYCKEQGGCSLVDGKCNPTDVKHCSTSTVACKLEDKCLVVNHRCQKTEEESSSITTVMTDENGKTIEVWHREDEFHLLSTKTKKSDGYAKKVERFKVWVKSKQKIMKEYPGLYRITRKREIVGQFYVFEKKVTSFTNANEKETEAIREDKKIFE